MSTITRAMTTLIVKTATAVEEASVVDILVLAFSADPPSRWVWPNPQQYLKAFPPFVKAFGGKAFAHGTAFYVEGYAGAALWLPPDVHADEDALTTLMDRTVSAETLQHASAVVEQMGQYHPSEPHWYLPLIGVDPRNRAKDTAQR